MNVVIINDYAYVNGGAGQVALSSAMALAEHNVKITLFSAVGPVAPELLDKANLRIICTNQCDILNEPNRIKAIAQGLWNTKAAKILADTLDCLDPNDTIIHVHSWTKALSSSIVPVAINKKFKVVCTLHDYFVACPNGGFFDYKKNEICRRQPLSFKCWCNNCDSRNIIQKQWRLIRQYIQKGFGCIPSEIKHFITISDFSRNILKPYVGLEVKTYTVPNPIDVKKREPVAVDQNKSFVAVGRISKEKGPFLFGEAARQAECAAAYIGDGVCKSELSAQYPQTTVTGWVNRQEVYSLLQKARVLVFASLCPETQGIVVMESAAMGIPAIVPDTCGAREMVINGVTGLWFQGGNISDLVKKMKLLQDDSMVQKMGLASYHAYWENPFTMDRHINSLLSVYEQILA